MFITDKCFCSICNVDNYFYWSFPDNSVGNIPLNKKYVFAPHDRYDGCYHVWVNCKKCHQLYTILYDYHGKRLKSHMGKI